MLDYILACQPFFDPCVRDAYRTFFFRSKMEKVQLIRNSIKL